MAQGSTVNRAVIAYRNGRLEASEHDDVWTVRLANLEARASYLDSALAELLGDAPEAHRAAARLLAELADAVEQGEAPDSPVAPVPRRERRPAPRHRLWAKPLILGLRVIVFAAVVSAAFMLTTWLTALR
jgi:hypothetical protein